MESLKDKELKVCIEDFMLLLSDKYLPMVHNLQHIKRQSRFSSPNKIQSLPFYRVYLLVPWPELTAGYSLILKTSSKQFFKFHQKVHTKNTNGYLMEVFMIVRKVYTRMMVGKVFG